jgi:glycine/D-amino acid oxidase-like deaminating enzyme
VPLALHDVPDVEALVRGIVIRNGSELSFDDELELRQHLLVRCWEISLRYQPGRIEKGFAAWATIKLKFEIIDWQRKRWGRTRWQFKDNVHTRELPRLVEFDETVANRLDEIESTRAGDPAASSDEDCGGLFAQRDRHRIEDLYLLGLEDAA